MGICAGEGMSSAAFTLRASVTASTLRSPAASGNKIGPATTQIASLKIYPLVQVHEPGLVQQYATKANSLIHETFAQDGLDIVGGDILVIGTTEYPIRGANAYPWPAGGGDRLHIIVEEIKTR